jgi:hypothetical protein
MLTALLIGVFASFHVFALEPASGQVILTISGRLEITNSKAGAQFDLAMLDRLPQQTLTTRTPWAKEPTTFTGPLLRDVLASVKAKGENIEAIALNDYKAQIPFSDTQEFDVLLASRMDGALIPIRTKGPLFIVYPYDSLRALQSATYYERSAWQLKALKID